MEIILSGRGINIRFELRLMHGGIPNLYKNLYETLSDFCSIFLSRERTIAALYQKTDTGVKISREYLSIINLLLDFNLLYMHASLYNAF